MVASEVIFNVEEAAEGGFDAFALGHSISTQADTVEELREAVRDAVAGISTTMNARMSSDCASHARKRISRE